MNQFESIKHINEYGQEYWLASQLQKQLEYSDPEEFAIVIHKAMEACHVSDIPLFDHFSEIDQDLELSRYACYLIVMNGDPSVDVIGQAQTYFAVKARQQELIENFDELTESEKRIAIHNEIRRHNVALVDAAYRAGVENPVDYAAFLNAGYMGMYGDLRLSEIKERKGLEKNQSIMDYMGSKELAANLFRQTQTEAKLRRDNVQGKENANATHYYVGQKVRRTIEELGGTMPEDLPTPEKSIKELHQEKLK